MDSLILIFLTFLRLISAKKDELFKSIDGIKVANIYKKDIISEHSKINCALLCVEDIQCISANYNYKTQACEFSRYHPVNRTSNLTEADAWTLLFKKVGFNEETAKIGSDVGNWTVVFRGTARTGIDVAESFVGTNANSLPIPEPRCYFWEDLGCNTHVRSSLIDNWETLNIKQVKVELIVNGQTVAYITFRNRVSDDKVSWFSPENILDSSWTDLISEPIEYIYFELERLSIRDTARSFHVFNSWGGCNLDVGWMFVSEVKGSRYCTFDMHNEYPVFIYSVGSVRHMFQSSDYGMADVMIISIHR